MNVHNVKTLGSHCPGAPFGSKFRVVNPSLFFEGLKSWGFLADVVLLGVVAEGAVGHLEQFRRARADTIAGLERGG